MNIDSKFIFYISFSDNPEALINAVFLNNANGELRTILQRESKNS